MRVIHTYAHVKVPATSANLGPAFDCMGLALDIWDDVEIRLGGEGVRVVIEGEGSDFLPRDESHLILVAMRHALASAGIDNVGPLELYARNTIPQGRGMGSSAAAVVAGLLLARALVDEPEFYSLDRLLSLATELEGHPDNAAPALYGGVTISWVEDGASESSQDVRAVNLHELVLRDVTVLVPDAKLLTTAARSVLPKDVSHHDASFNVSRTALLVLSLMKEKDFLMTATEDLLHQDYRAASMPASAQMVNYLRSMGYPAVISGAGPSVLVFGTLQPEVKNECEAKNFRILSTQIGKGAHQKQ